jgi:hypothetical protein
MNGAIYVENSANSKLSGSDSRVDATYVSMNSCPEDCVLRGAGCYAETSYVGIVARRLNSECNKCDARELARAEARAINSAYKGKDIPKNTLLRLHVVGDSRTISGTQIINKAIGNWLSRGGKVAYSYTHCWKDIPRELWNNVSMLASIDKPEQANLALELGYVPSLVVSEHISKSPYLVDNSDVKWIPCPAQTKGACCADCQLCCKSDYLFKRNYGITFSAHGVRKNVIKRRLTILSSDAERLSANV